MATIRERITMLPERDCTDLLIEGYHLLREYEPDDGFHNAIGRERDAKHWLEEVVLYLSKRLLHLPIGVDRLREEEK